MTMYVTMHNDGFDAYEATFKDWMEKIFNRIISIFNRPKENKSYILDYEASNNNEEFYEFFKETIKTEIRNTAEDIARFLRMKHMLIKEYYDFREIQRLLNNSLENDNEEELKIILRIIEELNDVTNFKFELLHKSPEDAGFESISDNTRKQFEERYEKFSEFLFNAKLEYYSISDKEPSSSPTKYFELMKDEILN